VFGGPPNTLPFSIPGGVGYSTTQRCEIVVALAPTGWEMIVYLPDGDYQIVDVMLVTRLGVSAKTRRCPDSDFLITRLGHRLGRTD